jgi:hypothetical protein
VKGTRRFEESVHVRRRSRKSPEHVWEMHVAAMPIGGSCFVLKTLKPFKVLLIFTFHTDYLISPFLQHIRKRTQTA